MKAVPFAVVILLGMAAILSAFSRGTYVPVPPALKSRPAVYTSGLGLRLDGLAVDDPWQEELQGVRPITDTAGRPLRIGVIEGSKLTQGRKLLLRVGAPLERYYQAFPQASGRLRWEIEPGLVLEVRGQSRVEFIGLEARSLVDGSATNPAPDE